MKKKYIIFLVNIGIILIAITIWLFIIKPPKPELADQEEIIPYDFKNPTITYTITDDIKEISGISFYKNNKLACIDKKEGIIYIYNLKKKIISGNYNFDVRGNFEDIDINEETAYIIKDDGKLFIVENFKNDDRKVTKLRTPLSVENNTEGIEFIAENNSLLISCKEKASVDKFGNIIKKSLLKTSKAIYTYDLFKKDLNLEPAYLIKMDEIIEKIKESTDEGKENEADLDFKPTGIALHPVTKDLFVIGESGKLLVIMDAKGELKFVKKLNSKLFNKPNGICFNESGDLFVSVTGNLDRPTFLKFNLKHKKSKEDNKS